MKILKISSGILVGLIVIFLLFGIITPRFSYESSITVKRPVEYAFSVFSNPDNMIYWMDGFVSIATISGKPETSGSKYKLVFVQDGERMELIETMTEFIRNQKFAFDIEGDPMIAHTVITFSALDSMSAKIVATTEVVGKNMLWRSILAISQSMFKENSDKQYESLRKLIEARRRIPVEAVQRLKRDE